MTKPVSTTKVLSPSLLGTKKPVSGGAQALLILEDGNLKEVTLSDGVMLLQREILHFNWGSVSKVIDKDGEFFYVRSADLVETGISTYEIAEVRP